MPWDWCPKSSTYSQSDHCHGHDGWQMTAERNKGCVIWTKCGNWRCFFSKCAFLYETKYFITISTFVFQIKDYLVFKDEWFRYFKQYLVNHILVNTSYKRNTIHIFSTECLVNIWNCYRKGGRLFILQENDSQINLTQKRHRNDTIEEHNCQGEKNYRT